MIDRYAALINQQKAGLSGNVFVHIGLQREGESELTAFEDDERVFSRNWERTIARDMV